MSDEKKFPATSKEVAGLLNLEGSPVSESSQSVASQPPADLPFAPDAKVSASPSPDSTEPDNIADVLGTPQPKMTAAERIEEKPGVKTVIKKLSFSLAPYLVVFVVGVVLYFVFFSGFSFTSVVDTGKLKIDQLVAESTTQELGTLQKQLEKEYDDWIAQFFFSVTDPEIIAMNTDVSGNGLNNFEKFLFNLNPKVYSTRGEFSDGQMLLKGLNPWTAKPLTKEQEQVVDKFINKELVNNRIAAALIQKEENKFSPYVASDSPYYSSPSQPKPKPKPVSAPPIASEPKPGILEIPSLGISVPLNWSKSVPAIDSDLKNGVAHYPGTAMPGEEGLAYISGHSSGYPWDQSAYKTVFASLGSLADGAEFTITIPNNGGQTQYVYVVEERNEYSANDQLQFAGTGGSQVALSTCWPVGSTQKRLVVVGRLIQTK